MTANTETNTAPLSNNADMDPHVIAEKAAHLWNNAERDGGKGDALACYALFHAWKSINFMAVVMNAKGDSIERRKTFNLHEYATVPCLKDDGSGRDNKMTNARTNAVLHELFGLRIDQIKAAHKTRLNRAVTAARYLVEQKLSAEQVQLTKANYLKLPLAIVEKAPADTASDKTKRQYEATKNELMPLDGRDNLSMAQVQRRAAEMFNKGNGANNRGSADPVVTLKTSIDFLDGIVKAHVDHDGEPAAAFNSDLRVKLFKLYQDIGKYFETDPMSETQRTTINRNEKKDTRASKGGEQRASA